MTSLSNTRFHAYDSVWEQARRVERGRWSGPDDFYRACIARAVQQGIYKSVECQVVAERNWLALGKPYYKLWPGYAAMLSRTSLAIPTAVFHVPHPAFAVYLPDGLDLFRFEHAGRALAIRALLVACGPATLVPYPVLTVCVDDGETERSVVTIHLPPGLTIEQCLAQAPYDGTTDRALLTMGLRLGVAVSLLAVSVHRCVEHDVIAALRQRYDQATSAAEREQLADKSRRRGAHGWCIGRGRCLALTTGLASDGSQPTGRQLNYQHIRGGHFHTVLHGSGRMQRKVVFFEPTVVRPDLPPPPLERARAG